MTYREIIPTKVLRQYVDAYWYYEHTGDSALDYNVLPDGCMDIILDLTAKKIIVYGAAPTSQTHELVPHQRLFGVRFLPGILAQLLEIDAQILQTKTMSLEKIDPGLAAELTKLFGLTTDDIVRRCEAILLETIGYGNKPSFVARQRNYHNVGELAQNLGMNTRTLQRKFQHHIGLTPKQFLRIARFQNTQKQLLDSTKPLAQYADEHGYTDQAHMTKDFRKLTTLTPKQLRMSRLYNNQPND